ncbi:LysR substrate-binding domain-containing protein [Acidovorax sp. Be4]|uniref:LysR substrate-binding domain-containing protein n=1 Tax=Acidovorax bellezanensis TaxID=2976702 RepID=A0ABT2PJI1_9BURK|nr:LysR substrate-binding domain-containing protein [Acidovorax sp. Be4]MCT9809974.1 LysR substrate-binding domain-containing protein [Acidovorax sp. Be4]
MEIRQLRYFLDIARTEHLTTSAKQLFVTQSTLSHGLRQIEEELGVQLFERVGRGLKLSQAGLVFKDYAARALQELEAGRMALADLASLQAGRLTVGVIPTFLHTMVPAAVAAFNARYPKIHVVLRELLAPEIETLLLGGDLDLGLAFHPAGVDGVDSEPVFEEHMQFVAHASHPLAGQAQLQLSQLQDVPLVLLSRRFATRRLLEEHLRAAGVQPLVRVEMESVHALIEACRWGPQLACIVPERAAALHGSGMCAIGLQPPLVRTASLLWNARTSRSAAAQAFASLLIDSVKETGTPPPPR